MAKLKAPIERPLSPHLQIYRPTLTMMMSIAHRLSGAALYFGTILLAMWLISVATGPAYFAFVNEFFSSHTGRFLLLGYTWALIHHMLGGLRHLIWDTGTGFGRVTIEVFAWATLIGSVALTIGVWFLGYWVRGYM